MSQQPSSKLCISEHPKASDWATARGEKWLLHSARLEAMLQPVDEPLIDALHLDAPRRIVDIGCGTGATTSEILRRAPHGSVVQGIDISPASIEAARRRAGSDERLSFSAADVTTAPTPDVSYDRLVSRFGVMFFEDPPRAFGNLSRWLAPEGRFAFAVWGPPANNPWLATVRKVVTEVIELPPFDPDAPGPFRYAGAHTLLSLLEEAGFREIQVQDWHGALRIGGGLPASEAASFALAAFSTFGEMLASAGDGALADAQRLLTDRFSQHEREGGVQLNAAVHIVTGTRAA